MKKYLLLFFYVAFVCISVYGQTNDTSQEALSDSIRQVDFKKFTLDFSVPDMPAFKALGTDPSKLLRPTDIKDVAAMIEPFYSGGKAVIPKAFALEVAPWRIASKKWKLYDYQNKYYKRVLYNTSFSFGTNHADDEGTASKLGLGLRTSFVSKKDDWITSEVLDDIVNKNFKSIDSSVNAKMEKWLIEKNISRIVIATDSTKRREYQAEKDRLLKEEFDNVKLGIEKKYERFVKSRENSWVSQRFDFALSWVGQSPDSLIKNASFSSFHVWATYATKLEKLDKSGKSQLLVGSSMRFNRTDNPTNDDKIINDNVFTGNVRFYRGTPSFRGFLEYQYKYEQKKANKIGLINLGAELSIQKKFWVSLSGGIENLYGKDPFSQFVSSIDLRYGFSNN